MEFIYQGILLGLSLSVLIGPLFVAQSQATLSIGFRAGMMLNLGIWISDVVISYTCFLFIKELGELVNHPDFRIYLGIAGVIVLMLIGFGLMFRKYRESDLDIGYSAKAGLNSFIKGFLVNTINPFTFTFWITVSTSYIIAQNATNSEALTLINSILAVIIITDTTKVYFAKRIKSILKPSMIVKLSQISGAVLVILSFLLLWRVTR